MIVSNRLIKKVLLLLAISFPIISCAKKADIKDLVWPLPPDLPRIKYLKAIYSSADVKKPGMFASIRDALIGGEGSQRLAKPFGVYAKDDKLYVTDTVLRTVFLFDFKNSKFTTIGTSAPGILIKPIDVFAGKDERIYVTDATQKKVMVYDKDSNFIVGIGKEGEFDRPGGVAVNDDLGRVYVSDIQRHKINVFDKEGNLLFDFGKRGSGDGEFNFPVHLCVDREGKVYVVDSMNFRVEIFNPDGKFLSKFGEVGDQFGMFARPKGISIDTEGHIYVVDAAFNNVQIFNQEGQLLLFFANMGYERGELWLPAGMSIDEKDRIYIADQYNHRIQVYQYLHTEEGENEKRDTAISEKGES